MHIFYAPLIRSQNAESFLLGQEESHHCVKVLRLVEGNTIRVVNGQGGSYTAEISKADPRATVLKLLNAAEEFNPRNHYLHLAVAPTKNNERFEWFLEKATEIGIDEITPVICERSERKELKNERLLKVMVSAMKQSGSAWLPKLNDAVKLDHFLLANEAGSQQFIAHCAEGERSAIREHLKPAGRYTVLIGPEGDFTGAEVKMATEKGYVPVSLGQSRLRTETAALEACFEVNYLNRP